MSSDGGRKFVQGFLEDEGDQFRYLLKSRSGNLLKFVTMTAKFYKLSSQRP